MSVWRISEERFCLKFNHSLDLLRVLEGRPWVFDKNLIILEQVGNNDRPEEVCLDWCPFTVFVHDLPLPRQTRDIAEHIGNKLGQFIDMELSEQGHNWSSAWKLRISLNTSQPLKRALRLRTMTGADLLVTFTYARLPNFCYLCGKIGHIAKILPTRYEEDFVDPGDAAPYGPWLRANHQDRYTRSLIGSSRSSQNQSLRPKFHSSDSLSESWRRESPARGPAIFGNFSKPIYGKKAINQEEDSSPVNSISCHTCDNLYGKTEVITANVQPMPTIKSGILPPNQLSTSPSPTALKFPPSQDPSKTTPVTELSPIDLTTTFHHSPPHDLPTEPLNHTTTSTTITPLPPVDQPACMYVHKACMQPLSQIKLA
ncbi:UNVERIFIED_CONTAM: hypothetical protein Sangu_1739500 [Sesamum angustifolium]|uniref:Zinc knuckle CX2CX4HX4C domain-containing protein n=1 Tax=Sesamum angustifolium TaxID=2727405 RepID=A0AAW2M532_9LAMI